MINLGNYEEYFILYMDNELTAEQKLMVEGFVAQHPQLGEELEILISTRLPLDHISFTGKEELLSSSMKVNAVDESLLLYIDNELSETEINEVEQKISSNNDFALQHSLLMQTKLDKTEKVSHPNKKELYRYADKVVVFKTWMRIAAAVVLLLIGSLFFLLNRTEKPLDTVAITTSPVKNVSPIQKEGSPIKKNIQNITPLKEETAVVQSTEKAQDSKTNKSITIEKAPIKRDAIAAVTSTNNSATTPDQVKRDIITFDVSRFSGEAQINENAVVVNKIITHDGVTSFTPDRKTDEDAQEPADLSGDFKNTKKTSAKGFFRKVTRFIERNTGIGTANADDEVLIGAVALKLK